MLSPGSPAEEISAFQVPVTGLTLALKIIFVVGVPGVCVAYGVTSHSISNEFIVVVYLRYVPESTFHQSRKLT